MVELSWFWWTMLLLWGTAGWASAFFGWRRAVEAQRDHLELLREKVKRIV